MEKEESKVEYIISDIETDRRNLCLQFLKKPKKAQKFLHHTGRVPNGYHCTMVVEKEDRISIISKDIALRHGANGSYLKSGNSNSAITYKKKGRSNQRLSIWNTKHAGESFGLMRLMCTKVNVDNMHILNDKVIKYVHTKGMIGAVINNKITSITEAMQYYIRYSLRGSGVKQESAESLHSFLEQTVEYNVHPAIQALRVASDPNKFLADFAPVLGKGNKNFSACRLNQVVDDIVKSCQALDERIDWADQTLDYKEVLNELSKKVRRTEEFLRLWEGGPVLESVSPVDNPFEDFDDMPF